MEKAQLLGSSQGSWTVIDAVGSPRDPDLSRLSAPAPQPLGRAEVSHHNYLVKISPYKA
ncbi:hypothetical protein D4764_12G0003350 [Takifugu flavidus]|uniref:Uncharacterized protein n=1 Tax=Takifugu flavidus TaxID=433684 RepID=A0A5C6PC29_9TELE|nr:hypothetical protein D4764_12G0003350 [Takifugu flavidus]